MKKPLRIALIAAALLFSCALSINAQIAMTRTTFTGAFSPITTGSGGATLSTAFGDDVAQDGLPIGFTFNYLGTNYTTMAVSTNGWASFNTVGTLSQNLNTNLYTTTGPNLVLGPWWDDLRMDSIVYITTGTPGSQVFTIQWNGNSYYFGATQVITFQLKLYEGTNVIEFQYGNVTPGTVNTAESASIGIEGVTGGNGNYLDAVTGSYYCGQYFMQAATKWPTRYYRFTPGVPTPVAGGVYTVGTAGNYPTIDEAVADLNHRGVAGPVVLSLTQATYDVTPANGDNIFPVVVGPIVGTSAVNTITIQPAVGTSTFSYDGAAAGGINNGSTTAACGTTQEPILALCGAKYTIVNNINFTCSATGVVDRGIEVINQSGAATGAPNFGGSQFNAFTNVTVQLNRGTTSSIGIEQRLPSTPSAITGVNSSNAYMNLNISNVYAGIYLLGSATFPDLSCVIGNTSPTAFNTIGGATANDIGNGTGLSYGIRCASQSGVSVYNNEVRNVTVTAGVTCDGILMELTQGTSNVYMNKVHDIRNNSATATTGLSGIRGNVATSAGHSLRIYNNFVYNLSTGYTGIATATRQVRGIYVQSAGGGLTSSNINVDYNSVNVNLGSNLNASATCFEIGTTTGPVINVRSNIFNNSTGAQVAPAGHYTWCSTSATLTGNTGSISNNNDLYVANTTEGYVGRGALTNYATLANWQAAMVGQDVNSVSTDPVFVSPTDLHVSSPALDGVALTVAWVTVDIDNQARSVASDIGADEFTASPIDLGATMLVTPVAGGCYSSTETVTIRIRNTGTATHDFSVNPATVTVNVTGAIVATINTTVNTGTLASLSTLDVVVGTVNMTTAGTYVFNAYTTQAADPNTGNDAMPAASINYNAGTSVASPGMVCDGSTTTLTLSGNTSTSIQWQLSTDGGLTWNNIVGATASPYVYTPTDTSMFRAMMCGILLSSVDTAVWVPTTPPTTVGDTACGLGTVTLTATGTPALNWYDAPSGGNLVNTGTTYSPVLAATDTFYVESSSGAQNGLHTTTYAAGNGSSGNCFSIKALTNITITSFDGHLSSAASTNSTWEIWYRPNDYLLTPGSHLSNAGWTLLGTASTPSAGPGNPTVIPIPLSVSIPAGQTYSFQIFTTTGAVSYSNGTFLGALWNANPDLEVYQGHGGTAFAGMVNQPRVFNGRIHYTSGCSSTRTPVIAVITTPPAVTATSSNDVCGSGSSTLVASSGNANYTYGWAPGATLNTTVGDTVIASPLTATTYTMTATDAISGCVDTVHVFVDWFASPAIVASASPDTICSGSSTNLDVQPTFALLYQVGTNTIQNTASSYPAPYGNFFWGARHQILITAADLVAAGMGPGYYSGLDFFATNLNVSQPLTAFEIKMGMSSQTSITTWYTGPMTSLYLSPSYSPTLGVNSHAFSSLFYWDGVSSIIIETCFNNTSWQDNVSMAQTTTAYTSCVYYRADAAGVCSNMSISATANQRPVVRFARSTASYGYTWTPAASLDNPLIQNPVGMPMITTDYVVSVVDSISGCITMDTVTVTVNQSPDPNFGADTAICSNATLLLDGTAGTYAYLWQDMSTNQTYSVSAMGTYDVMVTDTVTGCTGADTILVGINSAPVFTLGADATVCAGTQVTFSGPSGQYIYMWSTSDTTVSILTGTAGTYELAVTDSLNGCSSVDTVILNVNPLPVVALGADTSVCSASGSLTLSGPAGTYEYLWNTSDTTMSVSVNTTGTYAVLVTDTTNGCYSSDTVAVTYNTSPVASIGNDTTFCSASGPLTLMGPAGPYMYMWSDMTSGMSTTASSTGNYYLDVTDSLTGCTATDSIMVTVNTSPSVTLADTTQCGSQLTLSAPAGPYAYLWSTSATSQAITVSASGSYAVTVTDSLTGCDAMDSAMVTLNSNPTVTASASSMAPCADDANVVLTGSPAGGTFTGTSVTGNSFDPSVGAGTYAVVYNYTDGNGCSGADTVSIVVSACVGIGESFVGNGMTIYPNPNAGSFTFTAADQNCNELTIEITTVEGKVLQSNMFSNVQGNFVQEINMNEYANGIYIMRVTTDGAVYTQRVVKQE